MQNSQIGKLCRRERRQVETNCRAAGENRAGGDIVEKSGGGRAGGQGGQNCRVKRNLLVKSGGGDIWQSYRRIADHCSGDAEKRIDRFGGIVWRGEVKYWKRGEQSFFFKRCPFIGCSICLVLRNRGKALSRRGFEFSGESGVDD